MRIAGISLVFVLVLCTAAEAITIGPSLTKKERERLGSSRAPETGGFEAVIESFLKEDFARSERSAAQFLRRARTEHSDEAALIRALSLMKLGRYEEARPMLERLEKEAGSEELRAQAAYSLGDSYYFQSDREQADAYYKEAVRKYPSHGEAEQVRRLLGLSHPAGQFAVEEMPGAAGPALLQYSVQVGAFSRRRNAERLLNKLLRNRYDAYISPEQAANRFRVRVGHLSDRAEAQTLELRLKEDGYPTQIFP